MKLAITIILFLIGNYCMAQYLVNWGVNNACEYRITDSKETEVDKEEVQQSKKIEFNIYFDTLIFQKISYREKNKDSYIDKTPESLGFSGNATSINVNLTYKGGKTQFLNDTEEMAYPFQFKVTLHDGKTCELTLGSPRAADEKMLPELTINILEGVKPNTSTFDILAMDINEGNAIIVLDGWSAKSGIYRGKKIKALKTKNKEYRTETTNHTAENSTSGPTSKNEPKKNKTEQMRRVKYLRFGDQVNIVLTNFNHYLYKAYLDDHLLDFEYENDLRRYFQPKDSTDGKTPVSTSGQSPATTSTSLTRLREYAEVVKQMEEFIQFVKDNPNPNSKLLDENKQKILDNIDSLKIGSGSDIITLYELLSKDDQKLYEDIFETAKKFGEKRSKIRSLTYTVKANLLPIDIRSNDKLALNFSVKDQKGAVIEKRNYEFMIIGGWQVNQSFGVVGHGLFDDQLSLLPTPGRDTVFAEMNGIRVKVPSMNGAMVDSISQMQDVINQKIIADSSQSQVSLGATTFTHLYYRLGKWSLGPELGVSVDFFPKTNIRYLAGGSLMFMDGRFRVSLDAGYAFGKVMALSPTQKVGDILGSSATSPNLVEKSMQSFYIGLSWNVPLDKKDTQTTSQ